MSSFLAGALMITFFAPASMWAPALSASVKRPVRLEDDVHAQVAPRQVRRVLTWQDLDLAPSMMIDVVACTDLARVGAVGRVVLEQERVHLDVDEVVDGDDLDVRASAR